MPDSKLPPLTFHRLSLLKRRKRSGILTAKLCAQIFSNPISEGALILSTNGHFSAPCIHGDGRDTPNAAPNYCDRAENLSVSFFTEPSQSRRLIRSTKHRRQKFSANTSACSATSGFPTRFRCSRGGSGGRNGNAPQ